MQSLMHSYQINTFCSGFTTGWLVIMCSMFWLQLIHSAFDSYTEHELSEEKGETQIKWPHIQTSIFGEAMPSDNKNSDVELQSHPLAVKGEKRWNSQTSNLVRLKLLCCDLFVTWATTLNVLVLCVCSVLLMPLHPNRTSATGSI